MATDRSEKAALAHAAKGYPVLPLEPPSVHGSGGKDPIGRLAPHGAHSATTDEQTIRRWWRAEPGANIGIALGNGIMGLDADPRHGIDPDEIAERIGMPPLVRTGEAGEPDRSHPNSLSGVRGGHWYFRADAKGCDAKGIELRGSGRYLVAPGSRHASGVLYAGELPPPSALPPMPDAVPELFSGNGKGPAPPVDGEIPRGERDNVLTSLAGSMRRRGMIEPEILAALRETNRRCQPPLDDRDVAKIAKSVARYEPADVPHNNHRPPTHMEGGGGPRFEVQWAREEDMRAPQWAFDGRIRVGKLNSTTGAGGAGKGTFQAYMFARWTRGELPGCFHGTPIKILIVGDEDSLAEDWTPRVKAAGGDVTRIAFLNYVDGIPLDLVRDIDALEEIVRDGGFSVIHLDQALDHLGHDLNANNQKDVRRGLAPLRGLAGRAEIVAMYSMHSIKSTAPGSVRLLTGGSGQFTDLPRSSLFVGYHPDRPGWRAVGVGKNNARADVPTLVFRIEGVTVTNPQTGEAIETTRVVDLDEDRGVLAEEIDPHPPKEKEEPKASVVERVLAALGSDCEWHTRKEAVTECRQLEVSVRAFEREFPYIDWIERKQEGRETLWRLKD